jgi:hypothetical protein
MELNEINLPSKYVLQDTPLYEDNSKVYEYSKYRNTIRIVFYDYEISNTRDYMIYFEYQLCGFNEISGTNEINTIEQLEQLTYLLVEYK